ncbi:MAG: surface protein, partial [Flavipsychrobacter sp.]|nr:surface protein [Flavipsychrobacter sp.]
MRKIILLLILLTCFRYGYSQSLSSYSFNAFSCPYDSLTTSFIAKSGNTPGGGGPYDDCYYNSIPIGFNFDYCGTTYTSLSASSNCWITLGQTLPFSSSLIVNTYDCDLSGTSTSGLAFPYNLPRPILAALWMDVVTTGPNVRYTTKGTAPNRVFVIEWTNCGFYSFTGVYPPHINVEILLYETTNNIDFTYSTISPGSSNTGLEAIGITGGAGAYPVTGTQPYWSLSDAGPSPTASMTVETRSIPTLPATDQVYRWSYQCAGKPEAGNISPSISSSCSSFSSTLSLECTSSKGAGITYQWQSSPDSVTWTNISGAKADTYAVTITVNTYFRCILTCTNSNLRDTTNGAKLQLNPPPAAITGTAIVCASKTTTLTDATSGGFWSSSNTTIATVSGGVVTGSTAGTSTITYKLLSGCFATRTVTVNPMPGAITGIKTVCTGYTTLLSDALTGGTWSTANTSIATVNSSTGLVTGISAGTALITYSKGTGAICEVFTTVTVNATPLPITGANSVCVGLTTSLSSVTGGGTWTSSNTSVATINPSTGLVTGIMAGTSIISYTLSTGCAASIIVTVNPLPSNIVGSNNVCIGQTVTLASLGGGTWTSGNTTIATIGISSGVVTGISTGSTTITYTLATGCITTVVMNVHANPAAITGTTILCTGGTTTLSDATPVGLWSSSNTTVASIGSLTGFVTGLSAGTTTITYLSTAGCKATTTVTINPLPPSISGGPGVCLDNSITLNDAITGGTWTSSNTSIADIDLSTGVMTGMSTGTATITYTLAIPGCVITTTVTVNPPPAPITGPTAVCAGASIAITDATPGGTWSSSNTTVAIVIPGGTVFGSTNGTTTITYKAPGTGCITTTTITVSSAPVAISGVTKTCIGSTTTLSDLVSGGTWTSGNTSIATAGYTTGVITGMAAGTVTISYSLGGSCIVTIVVTVNTLPPAITGTTNVCPGATTTLTGGGGGIWSSSNTTIATVNTSTGLVTGIVTGTATITYTVLSTGCSITRTVTVSPVPAAISGAMTICIGNSWTLSNTTTGGTWTSSNTGIATISLSSGLLSGIATGTASITYTAPVTGCSITGTVTVTPPPPAITGITNVCQGSTTTLSDAASGGTWSSSITTIATIGTSSGVVTGIAAGTTTITYTPPSGCAITTVVTVDPLPSAISGPSVVCAGGTMTLTNSGGGTWSSGNTAVATIGVSSGLVTGVAFGTTTITYTLPTGCETTITITVSPAPVSISGSTSLCIGTTTNLTDAIVGGTWTSGSTAIATVGSASGIVTGVAPGTANIIYSLGTGCTIGTTVTVGASPAPITGITNICIGTAMSTLSDATTGGTWTSSNTAVATIGLSSGNISGITAGTATITYTNGCTTITTVTVNQTPTAITGPGNVCQGSAITLSDAVTGGTWTSGNTSVATTPLGSGNISGLAAGTATITYTLGSGCAVTKVITVNPVAPITGSTSLCTGIPETLSDAITGGTWTSSNTLAATVGLTTGTVTGHIAGSTVTINYRSPYGCLSSIIISVNSAPAAITGITKVCAGQTTTLSDGTAGGSWTSSNTTIATAGSSSGVISGIAAGTATITYSLGFGCTVTTIVTVNPASAVITGATGVCAGSSITISNSSPGGTWSSSNTAVATIGVTSGTISGLSAGTTIITYALTGGCSSTRTITVNPLPGPISGGGKLCVGQMLTLYESMTGGTWSGSSTAVATIGSSSGDVTGVSPGIFTAVYTINGCTASTTVTVIPSPLPITGPSSVCVGSTTTLSNGTPGGIWTTSGKSIAVIDAV